MTTEAPERTRTDVDLDDLPSLDDVLDDDDGHAHSLCPRCYPRPVPVGIVVETLCEKRYPRSQVASWTESRPDCEPCDVRIHGAGCPKCGLRCPCQDRRR